MLALKNRTAYAGPAFLVHTNERLKRYISLLFLCFCSALSGQVVINEILPDPGNYDGQGAEWLELYNTGSQAEDLSCWILTDGEEIVMLPSGTMLPPNGYLLIYNSNFFNCTSCNWDPTIISQLATNPQVVLLDLATCNCTNQNGPCYSVTWENTGAGGNPNASEGERIVLFDEQAIVQDALYYGNGARVNMGAFIPEDQYADGLLTAGIEIIGNGTDCVLPASNNYDIPPVPNPVGTSNADFQYTTLNPVGCTSSISRTDNGSSTWFIDNWPTPGQSNTIPDYIFTYAVDGGSPVDISDLTELTIPICLGETLTFSSDIYGFNQIYHDNDGDNGFSNLEGGSARGGSHIDAIGGLVLTNEAWIESAITPSGVTNVNYTTAPINSNTRINLLIKENTQSQQQTPPASQTCVNLIVGSGAASECYIQKEITVEVVESIVSINYVCNNGLVTVTTVPNSNFGSYSLALTNSADNSLNQTFTVASSPYFFQLSQGNAADYSLAVSSTQSPNCTPIPTISGGPLCVFAPPCPSFTGYDACTSPEGSVCPSDIIQIAIEATNLSNGTTIEYVIDTDGDSDPYDETEVLTSQSVSVTTGSLYMSSVIPNPSGSDCSGLGSNPGENITLSNSTNADIILNNYTLESGSNTFAIPNGTVVPANGDFTFFVCPSTGTFLTNTNASVSLLSGATVVQTISWTAASSDENVAAGISPIITTLTPACAQIMVPDNQCAQGDLVILPRIYPNQAGCNTSNGGNAAPTLAARTYAVNCPTAVLTGETAICDGASATMPIFLGNIPSGCTMVSGDYQVNGGAALSFGPLPISNNQVLLTGLLSSGIYTLASLSFSGGTCSVCTAALLGDFIINTSANPIEPTVTAQTACMGQPTILTANGQPDLMWYSDAALTMEIGGGAQIPYTGTNSTTVYVKSVNIDNGCQSAAVPVPITIANLPMANAGTNQVVCFNSALNLNGMGSDGTGAYNYVWTSTATNNFTSQSAAPLVTSTAMQTDEGSYFLYVEDANGCYALDEVEVELLVPVCGVFPWVGN